MSILALISRSASWIDQTPSKSQRLAIDPFLEDLAKGADRVFYFEEGRMDTPRLTADEGSEDAGGVLVTN